MVVTTTEELLDLIEKSGLLSYEQFGEAHALVQEGDDAVALGARLTEAGLLSAWQAAQLVAGGSNFFIGNYKLVKLLGRGGMGKVYLGEHAKLDRLAALKVISQKVRQDSETLERFLAEARAIATLDHPNIVQAYSVDNEGDRFYLVMEYIDGQNLEQLVESEGPLDYRVAVDFIRQAADGLEHGHSRNLIHRDVKPSNLLVNQQGVVKLVDMGLAQLQDPAEAKAGDKDDDQLMGSVDYLAPEQAMASKDLNHRADIYSLGCTLYFLLTGQPPFPGGLLHEKLMKHQSMQPESIKKLRSNVPKKVVEVCEKMMAKKPEDRYQSAAEVSKTLQQFPTLKHRVRPVLVKQTEPLPDSDIRRTSVADDGPATGSGVGSGVGAELGSDIGSGTGSNMESGVTVLSAQTPGSSGISGTRARVAGLLHTRQGKMIAAVAAGIGGIILAAIVIPFVTGSGNSHQGVEKPRWLTDVEELPPVEPPPPVPVQRDQEPPATVVVNPLGIELGRWHTTGPLRSKGFSDALFPEKGVYPLAEDAAGNRLWNELPGEFDDAVQVLPGGDKVTTYLFRTIKTEKAAVLPIGFGSNHVMQIWLNGEETPLANVDRKASTDSNRIDLGLGAGENRLLLKIFSLGGDHQLRFSADLARARLQEGPPAEEDAPSEKSSNVPPPTP